jgi:hypothetical protein
LARSLDNGRAGTAYLPIPLAVGEDGKRVVQEFLQADIQISTCACELEGSESIEFEIGLRRVECLGKLGGPSYHWCTYVQGWTNVLAAAQRFSGFDAKCALRI